MTQPEALRRYKLTRRWRAWADNPRIFGTGSDSINRPGGYVRPRGNRWRASANRGAAWFGRTYKSLPAALRAVERWLERAKEKKR